MELNDSMLSFLDIFITKPGEKNLMNIYSKPVDSKHYVYYLSNQLKPCLKIMIYYTMHEEKFYFLFKFMSLRKINESGNNWSHFYQSLQTKPQYLSILSPEFFQLLRPHLLSTHSILKWWTEKTRKPLAKNVILKKEISCFYNADIFLRKQTLCCFKQVSRRIIQMWKWYFT